MTVVFGPLRKKARFLHFAEQNINILQANLNHTPRLSYEHVSILTLGGL